MLLPRFEYHRTASVPEALEVLGEHGDRAAVLAGGTDLLVNMKNKKVSPEHIVCLGGMEELKDISANGGRVRIGPMLTAAQLADSGKAKSQAGVLSMGAALLGSPQVRSRATLGGNVCTARPAADLCVALLALAAKAVLAGKQGEREVALDGFFTGPGETQKVPEEILCALVMDPPQEGTGWGYQKLGLRKAVEIALVNVAASLTLDSDGKTIKAAKVALGAVAPTPVLSPGAEKVLVGSSADGKLFQQAAEAAAGDTKPIDDHRGSAWYRLEMIQVLTRRALEQAWQQAQGS